MSLARFTARQLSVDEVESLVKKTLEDTHAQPGLEEVILFGSAVENRMDEGSDLDLVYIFDTENNARSAQKKIHGLKTHLFPCDFICVDRNRYEERSKFGGVLFVARTEGRVIYRKDNGSI